MTDQERIARAHRAKMAMDEFLAPTLAAIEGDYMVKIRKAAISVDPRAPEIITRLSIGVEIANQIRAQIEAIIADGGLAERERARTEAMNDMSASKRRLLNIASH